MKAQKGRFARLFSWYPADSLIRPGLMDKIIPLNPQQTSGGHDDGLICIQSVPDKFFFLLFGLIRQQLRLHLRVKVDLIPVRAISGAVGVGWLANFKRWSVLTWWWLSQWERAWGANKVGLAYRCAAIFQPVSDLRDWHRSKSLWIAFRRQKDDFHLQIGDIEIGDMVVDSYLRFRPSPKFDVHDPFIRHIIWQALRDEKQATRYFRRNKPRFYLSSYSSYIEHGVTVRVALKHGVPVYTFGDLARFGKKLNLRDVFHTIDYTHFRADFERMDHQETRLAEAKTQLEVRLGGGIDAGTSYMRQSAYGKSQVVLPPNFNGSAVIFLHDFYDSYNAYPDLIFCDFWQWICFTIETLAAAEIKFYMKAHPNQIDLSDAVMADLRKKYPKAQWLPAGLNNVQLVQAGMICGVTAYGTVSNELAYMGIPTIGYGKHPHHSFEFCRTAKSREEYKAMLLSPELLPIDKSEMKKQALIYYYMRNLYGSADEVALRHAFIQLWRVCNIASGEDHELLEVMQNLSAQTGFRNFVHDLASQ